MDESEFPTVIGPDAKFTGQLTFEKGVKVLGTFEGQIASKGTLVIASGSNIQADVEAGSIAVEGNIKGNMAASDLIELKQTANLQGDIRCERLVVSDGASFVGHCNVGNGAMEKRPAPAAQKPLEKPVPAPPKTPYQQPTTRPQQTKASE